MEGSFRQTPFAGACKRGLPGGTLGCWASEVCPISPFNKMDPIIKPRPMILMNLIFPPQLQGEQGGDFSALI
jgi:hypothetical protein